MMMGTDEVEEEATGESVGLRVEGFTVAGLSDIGKVVGPEDGRIDGTLDRNDVGAFEGHMEGI
jgi:hypothetical protein